MFNNKSSVIDQRLTVVYVNQKLIGSYWKYDYERLYEVSPNFKQNLQNHTTMTLKQLKKGNCWRMRMMKNHMILSMNYHGEEGNSK